MAKQLIEQELRQRAVRALSDSLGPVDALRFLAPIFREPFDYQQWRKEYFAHYSVDDTSGKETRYWLKHKLEIKGLLKMLERVVSASAKLD